MMAPSGFQRSWVDSRSIMPRVFRQRATQNIGMAIESEKEGELAHERL
jgi:hypothetical protein